MARYYIETYGCTSNRGESQEIEQKLQNAGHRPTELETADVAIMNTCTVVETTEHRMLRRAKELTNATNDLIITGCMALAQHEEFEDIDCRIIHWDNVPAAVGNGECPTATADTEPILEGQIGILPIARGCMSNCSYCITKQATGRLTSRTVRENVSRVQELVNSGAREIRLTGQDTGVYGWDLNQGVALLPELLDQICTEVSGQFRVRLGMANPGGVHDIREELAAVFAEHNQIYNFLHLPVQSGSNAVLRDMRRQHTVAEFREIVDTFETQLDYWTLATDFIAGFPTESQSDHEKSINLLEEIQPEKINVTRFSKRPKTDAAKMDGLGGPTKKKRSKDLSERKRSLCETVHQEMVGKKQDVLVVEEGREDSVKCRDQAYRQIIIQDAAERGITPGDFLTVKVTASQPMYVFAEPVETEEKIAAAD